MTPQRFRTLVWKYYKEHGRHTLPWRKTKDPYPILVSEIMLQQTQVDRVIPYYRVWIRKYPTVQTLAKASLAEVLMSWQGLGYNRRAKMLHEAAKAVVREHVGRMPKSIEELEMFPGVGPYTARAVAAFAYNQDVVFIETNIRTAIIHHFFADRYEISDAQIMPILAKALPRGQAREWYAALMDYGAHLKRSGIRTNAKSKGYAKQSTFKGSGREVRGAILRELAAGPATKEKLAKYFPKDRQQQVEEQLLRLTKEGMIQKTKTSFKLPA